MSDTLTLEPDYTAPDWWLDVPSVDGVPDALDRDFAIDDDGQAFLEQLSAELEQRAARPDVQRFMATLTRVRKPSCVRVKWRGVIVCSHSVPKYEAWAKSTGQSVLLWPLAGCGSFQTTTVASAGTHAGGGAIDINANPHTPAERSMVARKGREVGLQVDWFRGYIKGLWTNHYHSEDPDCPELSKAAAAQCVECFNGGDGLVGTKPDPGWRGNIPALKGIFDGRLYQAVADIGTAFGGVAQSVVELAKVRGLLAAVRQPQTGYWDIDADIDLRNTQAEAADRKYDGANFNRWAPAWRQRMQRSWGCKTIDGKWGPQTAAACKATVVAMQRALAVTADGDWGPVTEQAYTTLGAKYRRNYYINRPTGPFPRPGQAGSLYGPSTSGKAWFSGRAAGTLTTSQIQWQIKRIQRAVGATADGIYGSGTTSKVIAWQKAHKVTADGLVGPITWDALVKANHA